MLDIYKVYRSLKPSKNGIKMSEISCLMNVRNVLGQGYPFVQAIKAALPICDEFIVSDGYSIDGTFETFKKLKDRYSKIDFILKEGKNRKKYLVSAENKHHNIDVVKSILKIVNKPNSLIQYVADRPGHDVKYALDPKNEGIRLEAKNINLMKL